MNYISVIQHLIKSVVIFQLLSNTYNIPWIKSFLATQGSHSKCSCVTRTELNVLPPVDFIQPEIPSQILLCSLTVTSIIRVKLFIQR